MSTPQVESWIIGALLQADSPVMKSNAQALLVIADLAPDAFTDMRARHVWQVIVKLAGQHRPVTVETVFAFGRGTKLFSDKDVAWLREWEESALLFDKARFAELTEQLRVASRKRVLLSTLKEQVTRLEGSDVDLLAVSEALTDAAEATIATASNDESTGDLDLAQVDDDWSRAEAGESVGIVPTGIEEIDAKLRGFVPNLCMLIGPPSGGKSATMATMIEQQLRAGFRVGFFGLEDGTKWLQRRLIARELGWPLVDVGRRPRDHATNEKLGEIYAAQSKLMANLKTYPRGGITTAKLLQVASRWRQRDASGRPGVDIIWVDHGGELDHTSDKVDEHRLRVGLSYKRIRDFAVNDGFPMVVLAHTRRRNDNDTEPRPPRADEVRDSSDIENAARLMLGMWDVPDERDHFRITALKVTEAERHITWRVARVKTAALLVPESAEVVDLAAERNAKAKARREEKEAERRAAREKREQEKAEKAAAKAKRGAQSSMFKEGT